jgi:hypothetical protein
MDVSSTITYIGTPELGWFDPFGFRWTAKVIWYPLRPVDQREIQIEAKGMAPERVLCVGLSDERILALSADELELIRRAAQSRCGIIWMDPRDGQIWWVREHLCDPSRVQPTYVNARFTGAPHIYMGIPITFMKSNQHILLLDDAREHRLAG